MLLVMRPMITESSEKLCRRQVGELESEVSRVNGSGAVTAPCGTPDQFCALMLWPVGEGGHL